LTAAYTGDGLRAWKAVNGVRTYFLYDGDDVVCELDQNGNPVNTYGYGANGLMQRYLHNIGQHISYVFDPDGNLLHRIRQSDPQINPLPQPSAGVFVADTALFDGFGQVRCDLDPLTGGVLCQSGPGGLSGTVGAIHRCRDQRRLCRNLPVSVGRHRPGL
jgi:hypothetical protein